MTRSTLILALASAMSVLAACSDTTGLHRSGSDDIQQVGDRKGKGRDSLPHAAIVTFSREAQPNDVQREPEARQEAQPQDQRREAEPGDVRQEAQPGDVRRGRGKDDAANHG